MQLKQEISQDMTNLTNMIHMIKAEKTAIYSKIRMKTEKKIGRMMNSPHL